MTLSQKLYLPFKRLLDVVLSIIALVLLSPILLIIAVLIKLDSKGPIFFKQKRVGKDNKHFNIYKFRTMKTEAPKDSATDQLSDPKAWITKVGSVLRRTSLDELPQLVNIALGHMSIIGPRPALWNQYKLNCLRESSLVHTIKPGLTGLAQIKGRDQNSDEEKAKLDTQYYNQFGFRMDLYCFIGTIVPVLLSTGVEKN